MDNDFPYHLVNGFPQKIDYINNKIIRVNLARGLTRLNYAISLFEKGASVSYSCSPSLSIATNRDRWKLGLPKGGVVHVNASRPIVFPELRPNTCGILTCEIKTPISNENILAKINKSKDLFSNELWDFGKDNHFVSLFESRLDGKKYALVHGSDQSIKSDNDDIPGLYIENSKFWQRKSITVDTPYGKVRCLVDEDAILFWETYLAAELHSKKIRLATAVNIFDKVNVVSDFVHVGMYNLNTINLGVNITSTRDAIFPLLTNFGEDIYFVSLAKCTNSGRVRIVPHSFGSDLNEFQSIKNIAHDNRGDLYELEHKNGMVSIVRDFLELPFKSRYHKELIDIDGYCFDKTLIIKQKLFPLISIKL